jgi:hypothetical protein
LVKLSGNVVNGRNSWGNFLLGLFFMILTYSWNYSKWIFCIFVKSRWKFVYLYLEIIFLAALIFSFFVWNGICWKIVLNTLFYFFLMSDKFRIHNFGWRVWHIFSWKTFQAVIVFLFLSLPRCQFKCRLLKSEFVSFFCL